MVVMNERMYLAIDLKSFYASEECVERGLDPLDANLVVADESRTSKTICLAVSPSLKALGISGRPRLFEVEQRMQDVNETRRVHAPGRRFTGESTSAARLAADPTLKAAFVIAKPHMSRYLEADDIIGMERHRSRTHAHMPVGQRAAQFMPFAALSGYGELIEDASKPVERRVELGEDAREELDRRLADVLARIDDHPVVSVTYFQTADRADRGMYVTAEGVVERYDGASHRLFFDDGVGVACTDIVRIAMKGADGDVDR